MNEDADEAPACPPPRMHPEDLILVMAAAMYGVHWLDRAWRQEAAVEVPAKAKPQVEIKLQTDLFRECFLEAERQLAYLTSDLPTPENAPRGKTRLEVKLVPCARPDCPRAAPPAKGRAERRGPRD